MLDVIDRSTLSPATTANCEHCSAPFEPRKGNGGKVQKFCSPKCRGEFHSQRGQHRSADVGVSASALPPVAPPPTIAQASPAEADSEFEWDTDDSVVVAPRRAIAVYQNPKGHIVIRQEAFEGSPDDDPFVFIERADVDRVIAAINEVADRGGQS